VSLRKPLAVAAGVTAAFVIGTTANAATAPIAPADAVGIPAGSTCPTWYGMPNAATGSCLPWCQLRDSGPCIPLAH
jgi:hypothetical protein